MLSYWESKAFSYSDYILVGAGIVGLSTALSLRERDPQASITILESNLFPGSASTRNAGFACFGSPSEILSDIQTMGEIEALKLVADRWKGLQLLRSRVAEPAMDYQQNGGYELILKGQNHLMENLKMLNQALLDIFERQVFVSKPELVDQFGFNQREVEGLIFNPLEAQIDPGKLIKQLMQLAQSQDISVVTGAKVSAFQANSGGVEISVENYGKLKAARLGICINGYSQDLLPSVSVKPGRGLILLTKPLPRLNFKGTFHYQEGFYYFRNLGTSVLFGGGRNLDLECERTTENGVNKKILNHLKYQLAELILPDQVHEIESCWSGIMGFGDDKRPKVEMLSPEVGYAVGLGGMGIALGSLVGEQLARLICLNGENV